MIFMGKTPNFHVSMRKLHRKPSKLLPHVWKLFHVLAVGQFNGVSSAAKKLRISQSALSHSIKHLESFLGSPVFDRRGKLLHLTETGRILVAATHRINQILADTETQLSQLKRPNCRMGTKEPFAVHLWPEFLNGLEEARSIDLVVDKSNNVLEASLERGELDCLILAEPQLSSGMFRQELLVSRYCYYRSPNLKLSSTLLVYKDAIVKPGLFLGDTIESSADIIDVQSFDAALALALRGLGIALLPQWMAKKSVQNGYLEKYAESKAPPTHIFFCSRQPPSKKFSSFMCQFTRSFREFA